MLRRRCNKHVSWRHRHAHWTTWQFTFKAFACAAHPKMKKVFDLATRKGSDAVVNVDMTAELQSLSTQFLDLNAMRVDAVHVNVDQERQGSGSGSRSDTGKGGKGGKGKFKTGRKGKEKDEKPASKFEGECRSCQKKGHKKAECRKMKSDIAAGKRDKHGKPTGVHSLTATGATQPSPQASYAPSMASTIPVKWMVREQEEEAENYLARVETWQRRWDSR